MYSCTSVHLYMGLRGLPARRRQRAMVCGTRSCERVDVYPRQESQRGALPACACWLRNRARPPPAAVHGWTLCGYMYCTKYISGFQFKVAMGRIQRVGRIQP
jgi:hypothetical protein